MTGKENETEKEQAKDRDENHEKSAIEIDLVDESHLLKKKKDKS